VTQVTKLLIGFPGETKEDIAPGETCILEAVLDKGKI
jgi:hypothetical protein